MSAHVEDPCSQTCRLFFALWPSEALRGRIEQGVLEPAIAGQGRVIPAGNLHVTLVFLGAVPAPRAHRVLQAGAAVVASAFDLHFDRLEFWSRSNLLCLTATRTAPALLALVNALRIQLNELEFEQRDQPFRPHITLVRDVRRIPPPHIEIAPVHWRADEFVLVHSRPGRQGARYAVIERWPLQQEGGLE